MSPISYLGTRKNCSSPQRHMHNSTMLQFFGVFIALLTFSFETCHGFNLRLSIDQARTRFNSTPLSENSAPLRWIPRGLESILPAPYSGSYTEKNASVTCNRRSVVLTTVSACLCALPARVAALPVPGGNLMEVSDPNTYSALVYSPSVPKTKLPLLVFLHGAGENNIGPWDLADTKGEHRGLLPSLLASGRAPPELTDNFAVVAPYSAGRRSFYEEPRSRLLEFVNWVCSDEGREAGCPDVDTSRVFLFGFSDGATVGVELATTGRFSGCIFAAYGFTGELPSLALERLKNIPIWMFHCADDVIFPVSCSDKLVKSLRKVNDQNVVRYTRFEKDQEGFTGSVKGHSSGITASRMPKVYEWLLSI